MSVIVISSPLFRPFKGELVIVSRHLVQSILTVVGSLSLSGIRAMLSKGWLSLVAITTRLVSRTSGYATTLGALLSNMGHEKSTSSRSARRRTAG
jgi:hypothetical protein